MIRGSGSQKVYWKTQLPVDFIDNSLTINDWSEVSADLSGGKPVRLWTIAVAQTNNASSSETVELELILNGTAYTITLTGITSGTVYFNHLKDLLSGGDWVFENTVSEVAAGARIIENAIPLTVDSVGLIRVRQTSTVDATSAQIEVNITWEKLVGV